MNAEEDFIRAYPNPTRDVVSVEFDAAENQKYKFELIDYTSRIIYSEEGSGIEGLNRVNYSFKNLSTGIYFFRLDIAGRTKLLKIVFEE